jgi:hypothetical protein
MREGDIMRVLQLGYSGYTFQHPAYARLGPLCFTNQRWLTLLVIDDRDFTRFSPAYNLNDNGKFNAPQHNFKQVTEDEAAAAAALFALNDGKVFVKPFNEVD